MEFLLGVLGIGLAVVIFLAMLGVGPADLMRRKERPNK